MVTSSLSGFPMFTDGRMSRPGGVQVYGALYSHLLTVHCTLVRRKRNCWAPGGAGSCDGQGQDASATRARKQETWAWVSGTSGLGEEAAADLHCY